LKYLFLPLILILTSCSLSKDSTYWNEDLIKKSADDKKITKIISKTKNFKSLTFNEFNLFLKDYSKNSQYPNIND
jgi:hypothetical protein